MPKPAKPAFTFPVKEDGEPEGQATVWKIDRHKELVLVEWSDGTIKASITKKGIEHYG